MNSSSSVEINNTQYELSFYLSSDELESIKGAPEEWLKTIYEGNPVLAYGANHEHLVNLFTAFNFSLNDSYITLKKQLMSSPVNWRDTDENAYYFQRTKQASAYMTLDVNLISHFALFSNYDGDENLYIQFPDSFLSLVFQSLQCRHHITKISRFTMEDYNFLTKKVRDCGFIIHPEDDPILGMIDYQKPYIK